jgi:hypothetical protein
MPRAYHAGSAGCPSFGRMPTPIDARGVESMVVASAPEGARIPELA